VETAPAVSQHGTALSRQPPWGERTTSLTRGIERDLTTYLRELKHNQGFVHAFAHARVSAGTLALGSIRDIGDSDTHGP